MTHTEIMRRIGEAYRRYGLGRAFTRDELFGAGKSRHAKGGGEANSNKVHSDSKHGKHLEQSLPQEEKGAA